MNNYVTKNNKPEFRTLNFDRIGRRAKLVTLAHGSKTGVEAYLKTFTTSKLTKTENADVHHKFFTDAILSMQPSSEESKTGGKESYFCTIQTPKGLASFRLIKRYNKNGEPTGKICEYREFRNIHSVNGKVKLDK